MQAALHRKREMQLVAGDVAHDRSARVAECAAVASGRTPVEMPTPSGRRLVASAHDLVEVDRTVRGNYSMPFDQRWLVTRKHHGKLVVSLGMPSEERDRSNAGAGACACSRVRCRDGTQAAAANADPRAASALPKR